MRALALATLVACNVDAVTFTPEVPCPPSTIDAPYAGGDGSPAAPFQVCSPEHLHAIATRPQNFDAAFVLIKNIDFAGATFPGIGAIDAPFTGRFDGATFGIANMTVSGADGVGLFNFARGARLSNIRLDNVTVEGTSLVGAVIGECDRSQVRQSTITGTVRGTSRVGGLIGEASECTALQGTLDVVVEGTVESIGGVVGRAGNSAFMGFEATVDVNAPLAQQVGGVVGADVWHPVIVQNVVARGSVVGNEDVAGLVGYNGDGSQIHRTHFEGTIRGNIAVGGIVGGNYDSPFHVWSTSVVADISGTSGVGGFSGRHYYRTRFHDSYFKGTLTGVGGTQDSFGGFFGDTYYYGWVERSYVDVTIDSQAQFVGGFMGHNQYWSSNAAEYDIAHSFAVANVIGQSDVSFWVGKNTDPNPLLGAGSYFWGGGTCTTTTGMCGGSGGMALSDRSQFETPGSTPLIGWDFSNVWQSAAGALPTLRLEQQSPPTPTAPCSSAEIAGLRYECNPTLADTEANEVRIAVLEPEHTCTWLFPDTHEIDYKQPLTAGISGTPAFGVTPPCTLAFSITDGAFAVPATPLSIETHPGVVMTPSQTSYAYHYVGSTAIGGAGVTTTFTLRNRESTTATIGVAGLPNAGFRFAGGTYPGTGGTCGATLAANASCTLMINFAPTVTGQSRHAITLQFEAARGPVAYPFELAGNGT